MPRRQPPPLGAATISFLPLILLLTLSLLLSGAASSSAGGVVDSYPPSMPIYKFYPMVKGQKIRKYPVGKEQAYLDRKYKDGYTVEVSAASSEEARERERLSANMYNTVRKAAEVHRRVRQYALDEVIKPGVKLIDMCEKIENATRAYLEADKHPTACLKAGIGFPTGCSLNEVAAHFSPNAGDTTVLKYDDVMKLDFGTHVDGYIVDSAFTWAPDPQYEQLLLAVKEATLAGIAAAGIDVRLQDVGEAVQEVMESYECEIKGKRYQVRCVRNLQGHSIVPFHIHAGKSVPITRGSGDRTRMEEGEVFAIETFGTTGEGWVREKGDCSHYMYDDEGVDLTQLVKSAEARKLAKNIAKYFGTLPWCRRYLSRATGMEEKKYMPHMKQLISAGIVEEYPPLVDVKGSYVAQYEHTIILRPTCKEVVSAGDDRGMAW